MGWISNRRMRTGCALYNEGPKRKGPLRKIVSIQTWDTCFFGAPGTGWLECGHFSYKIYGREKAICVKCAEKKPKDRKRKDGWPFFFKEKLKA